MRDTSPDGSPILQVGLLLTLRGKVLERHSGDNQTCWSLLVAQLDHAIASIFRDVLRRKPDAREIRTLESEWTGSHAVEKTVEILEEMLPARRRVAAHELAELVTIIQQQIARYYLKIEGV